MKPAPTLPLSLPAMEACSFQFFKKPDYYSRSDGEVLSRICRWSGWNLQGSSLRTRLRFILGRTLNIKRAWVFGHKKKQTEGNPGDTVFVAQFCYYPWSCLYGIYTFEERWKTSERSMRYDIAKHLQTTSWVVFWSESVMTSALHQYAENSKFCISDLSFAHKVPVPVATWWSRTFQMPYVCNQTLDKPLSMGSCPFISHMDELPSIHPIIQSRDWESCWVLSSPSAPALVWSSNPAVRPQILGRRKFATDYSYLHI